MINFINSSEKIAILGDLHLHIKKPEISKAFFEFLQHSTHNYNALIIIGDLFDFWIGDDGMSIYQNEIEALRACPLPIYIQHGNRDFLLGEDFFSYTNTTGINDPCILNHAKNKYLLIHGDSACTLDKDYQQFRSLTRSEAWQKEMLSKPLNERLKLANELRVRSGEINNTKALELQHPCAETIEEMMQEWPDHQLIHGHIHQPGLSLYNSHSAAVVGDWHSDGAVIIVLDPSTPDTPFKFKNWKPSI